MRSKLFIWKINLFFGSVKTSATLEMNPTTSDFSRETLKIN